MKRAFALFCLLTLSLSALSVSALQNAVSLRKTYELLTPASAGYPDEDYQLTNGRYGTPVVTDTGSNFYRNPEYVGFRRDDANADGNFVILLDLGESLNDLTAFELSYLNEPSVGVFAPVRVAFYGSEERDGDFVFLGERSIDEPTDPTSTVAGVAIVEPESAFTGRYVMAVVTPRATYVSDDGTELPVVWTFLDELTVLQGTRPLLPGEEPSPAAESALASVSPVVGDRGLLLLAALGASALAAVAFLGRRRS